MKDGTPTRALGELTREDRLTAEVDALGLQVLDLREEVRLAERLTRLEDRMSALERKAEEILQVMRQARERLGGIGGGR